MLNEGVLAKRFLAKRPEKRLRYAGLLISFNSELLHTLFSLLNGGGTLGLGSFPVPLKNSVFEASKLVSTKTPIAHKPSR